MTERAALATNRLKRNCATQAPQVGLWLTLDSPTATEIVAGSGYDWLLLDMEHTCLEASQVVQHLRAARAGTAEMVVRVPAIDPVLLKRLLDGGVTSLMFPNVQSAAEARQAVAATRYAPQGMRGVAGNMRANSYNRATDYFSRYQDELCVIVQLETPKAIAAIEEIAAVAGIDALFIGPNDLAASMGHLGKPGEPAVRALIAAALPRIRATGKAAGILNFVPAEARELQKAGFSLVAVGSDASILARRSESLLGELR
jgi:4-hydroxy-2-oxoheptanedioate aldolase